MAECIERAIDFLGDDPIDWVGKTFRQLLDDCELAGATVFWGCWSDSELDTIIGMQKGVTS